MFTSEKPGTAFHGGNRKWISRPSQNPSRLIVPNFRDGRLPGSIAWRLTAHSARTYNPSVNSRRVNSRLALQTQDLDALKSDFPGNWGNAGGTPIGRHATMIACEKAGCQACVIELGPRYCDVIVRRGWRLRIAPRRDGAGP